MLVVDDSLSVRKMVERALEMKGFDVLSASSGAEAMERIGSAMPGPGRLRRRHARRGRLPHLRVRAHSPDAAGTPVLLISGIVNSAVLERAGKVRCSDVLRKPFTADDLLHRIESLLPATSSPAPAAAPAPVAEVAPGRAGRRLAPGARAPRAPARAARARRGAGCGRRARAPDLKALLTGVAELAGVSLTALIDREGALMEVAGGLLPEAELAGALAACLVESTDGVGRALTQGRLQSLILEYDAGVVLLNAVGAGAMLAVVLGDPAVLGKVRYHVKKALPDLVRAV